MQQGLPPDSADYDGRTALMLAAGHGHLEAVKLLLAAGADPSRADALQVEFGWGACELRATTQHSRRVLKALLCGPPRKLAAPPTQGLDSLTLLPAPPPLQGLPANGSGARRP
jgi:ankyrin repeat protein